MNGHDAWSYRPYSRLTQIEKRTLPYICRIAPGDGEITLEWFDAGADGPHTLYYRRHSTGLPYARMALGAGTVAISGLAPGKDYEFYISRDDGGGSSDVRIAQASAAVGTVVNHLHPYDDAYAFSGKSLCSPSIVKLPSGRLVASMDVFAGGAPQNLSILCASEDGGTTWHYQCELFPCFWGKLFWHQGKLFMLANTTEYGDLVIGCSEDEGRSFGPSVTLLPGAGSNKDVGPHKAPMQVIEANGRLYTGIDYGSWGCGGHQNALLSIAVGDDPMIAKNWVCSGFCAYDPTWPGAAKGRSTGALEGNAVVGPDGGIYNALRYQMTGCEPAYGKALLLKGDQNDPHAPLTFDRFIDFNGGSNCKFELLYDKQTDAYWAIASEVVYENLPAQRNVLSLMVSRGDLDHFQLAARLLDYRDEDPRLVGFQYVSMAFDGDDLIYLCRTAMNKSRNHHDANYITFHRIEGFRGLLPE